MKETNYFKQSYQQIADISATSICHVIVKLHQNSGTNNALNPGLYNENFEVSMIGPFLKFNRVNDSANTRNQKSVSFYIFTPYFMTRRDFLKNSIEMIPLHLRTQASIEINFPSKNESLSFLSKIHKINAILLDSVRILPPVLASVKTYSPRTKVSTDYELSFINNIISLHSSQKIADPLPINVDVNSCIVPPFDMESCSEDNKGLSFLFKGKGFDELFITFENFDIMAFSFLTIYLSIEQKYVKTKQVVPKIALASDIMSKPDKDDKIMWPAQILKTDGFKINESSIFDSRQVPKMHAKVLVPEKASSHLELLQFDMQIKRNVYCYFSKKCEKTERRVEPKLPKTSFEGECIKIKSELFSRIPFYTTEKRKQKLFTPKPDFFTKTLNANGETLLNELVSKPIASNETSQFMKSLKFIVPNKSQPTPGLQIAAKIGHIITELNSNLLTDPTFIELCRNFCSILIDRIADDFYEKFSKLMNCRVNDFCSLTVFISKYFYKGTLGSLISLFGTKQFNDLYLPHSLMRNTEFIELFIAAIYPVTTKCFTGHFVGINEPVPLPQRHDIHCRVLSNLIRESLSSGEEMPKRFIAELVCRTSLFLSENYHGPVPSFFSGMRTPFYAFQVACNEKDDTDVIALRTVVNKITASAAKHPVCSLLIAGLKFGMSGKWFLRAIKVCKEENLLSQKSAFLDDDQVTNLADSLFSLSSILVEIDEDEIFSFDLQFDEYL